MSYPRVTRLTGIHMRLRRALCPSVLILLLCALTAAAAEKTPEAGGPQLVVEIDSASVVGEPVNGRSQGLLSGNARAYSEIFPDYDVVFLIDNSKPTEKPSGYDANGDGKVTGRLRFKKRNPDSILAAEVAALKTLLDKFDSRRTRVGVTVFSGAAGGAGGDQAWVEVEMTHDFDRVRRGLEEILEMGPYGTSNVAAGLRVARLEVLKRERKKKRRAKRHTILLTTGIVNAGGQSGYKSSTRAIKAAANLGRSGVRVHTYVLGPRAKKRSRTAAEIAQKSGGTYHRVEDPKDLDRALQSFELSLISELRVVNTTAGNVEGSVTRGNDGAFSALVTIVPGPNTIEIHARSIDGRERIAIHTVEMERIALTAEQRRALQRLLEIEAEGDKKGGPRRELEIEAESESDSESN